MSWVIITVVRPSVSCRAPVVLRKRVAGERVERAERLVHQDDARAGRQRAGDADALAFAARELVREPPAMGGAVEADQLDQLVHPARDGGRRPGRAGEG